MLFSCINSGVIIMKTPHFHVREWVCTWVCACIHVSFPSVAMIKCPEQRQCRGKHLFQLTVPGYSPSLWEVKTEASNSWPHHLSAQNLAAQLKWKGLTESNVFSNWNSFHAACWKVPSKTDKEKIENKTLEKVLKTSLELIPTVRCKRLSDWHELGAWLGQWAQQGLCVCSKPGKQWHSVVVNIK